MKTATTKTDSSQSISASEFVWDTGEASESNMFMLPVIEENLRGYESAAVLDLGCGNGYLAGKVSELGHEVTGCDYSASGIEWARSEREGVKLFQHDITTSAMPDEFTNSFDVVISSEVIEHLLLPRRLIESALGVLKPGGLLVISTPYHGYLKNLALALTNKFDEHWHPLRDFGHVKFFSRKTLKALLSEYDTYDIAVTTVGRIPIFARSMILTCKKK